MKREVSQETLGLRGETSDALVAVSGKSRSSDSNSGLAFGPEDGSIIAGQEEMSEDPGALNSGRASEDLGEDE